MELSQIVTSETEASQALIAGIGDGKVAIPLSSILTIENISASDINSVNFEDVIYLRGQVLPLVYLDKLFNSTILNVHKIIQENIL